MATKIKSRQIEHKLLLQQLGLPADATLDQIIDKANSEFDYPLRPKAAPVPDASLYFSNAELDAADESKKVLGAIKKQVFTAPAGLSIDFQARTVSNALYFDVTFPASTVGRYRRAALFFTKDGKIKVVFSAEALTQNALVNAGQLIPNGVIPLGCTDLLCTNALGSFKSATAASNVIEPQDVLRFSPGAGGTGGAGTTFDVDQVAHGFTVLTPIYFDGSIWQKALSSDSEKLAQYIVVEVTNVDQFTAANFGVFEIANALTVGEYYYADPVTAGAITPTEPLYGYSNPVLFVESATIIHAMCHRPSAIGDGTVSDSDIGAIMAFPTVTAPTGYVFCDGKEVSRVTYADLFGKIGTKYGSGDGSTTFNVPDLRGYFLRGDVGTTGGTFLPADVSTATEVITIPNHNFAHSGFKIRLTTSGTLPGGLSVDTDYFVIVLDANNFKLATSLANALAGTNINLTTTGSGVHTAVQWEDPDAAGRFSRTIGGQNTFQNDGLKSHTHNITYYYNTLFGGTRPCSDNSTTAPNVNATSATGGNETRPQNMSIGFFIRWAARGAIKAVLPAPGIQKLTSGSGTYVTPNNTSYLRIRFAGAGGGGSGGGAAPGGAGGNGGSTTFGTSLLTATGGTGGSGTAKGAGGSVTINSPAVEVLAVSGANGQGGMSGAFGGGNFANLSGGDGGATPLGGAGSGSHSNVVGSTASNSTGSGGGGAGSSSSSASPYSGGGGGAGGYGEVIINNPDPSYSFSIGVGGAGGSGTYVGGTGADGVIIVEAF